MMKYGVFTNTMPGIDAVGMIAHRYDGLVKFRTSREASAAADRRNWSLDGQDCQCVAKRIHGSWAVIHQFPVVMPNDADE